MFGGYPMQQQSHQQFCDDDNIFDIPHEGTYGGAQVSPGYHGRSMMDEPMRQLSPRTYQHIISLQPHGGIS